MGQKESATSNSNSASYVDLGVEQHVVLEEDAPMQKTIAIIGGGVSGLAAAWHLHENCHHNVHVFEKEPRLGGHAWTVEATAENGDVIPVDIGFMVFNPLNYPNLIAWFKCLQVKAETSNMSLSVSLDHGETVEWSSDGALAGLFGSRPQQAVSPAFYSFLADMLRFNSTAEKILLLDDKDPRKHRTTREFLQREGYGSAFQQYYLLPMMAALWSASLEDVLAFPAAQLVSFLSNHCMLQIWDRPTWQTVQGRSVQYVKAVEQCLGSDRVHCQSGVYAINVVTGDGGSLKQYRLFTANKDGTTNDVMPGILFDDIVFACHAPTACAILERSGIMVEPLRDIEYADNVVYVHSDPRLMPKTAWASWNCIGKSEELKRTSALAVSDGAFEGAESGFGNTLTKEADEAPKEGPDGRFRAVYVT